MEHHRLDDAHDREIDAYNAMVDEHARLAAAYNSALPEVNQQIEALNTQRRDYDARCAQQAYYERDRNALQRDGR